jgi:hypothetical protein
MQKLLVPKKFPLYQKRYLIRLFQIIIALPAPPDILGGKKFARVKLKARRFKNVGVQGHLDIDKLPALRLAVYVKANLPVAQIVDGRLIGGNKYDPQIAADDGRKKFRQRAPGLGSIPGEYGLKNVVEANYR